MKEEALLRHIQAGRRWALHAAIRRYTGYVTAVAARTLGPSLLPEDLEEVVSDVFVTLWLRSGDIQSGPSLRPWLAAVARNKAADRLRHTRGVLPLSDTLPAVGDLPEALVERQECHAQLRRAVEAMEEPDRTLFLLYYYEDQPLKEVAPRLGLSLAAAKARLSRGRKRLKEALLKGGIDHA